jgi:hypothetical protein
MTKKTGLYMYRSILGIRAGPKSDPTSSILGRVKVVSVPIFELVGLFQCTHFCT